ncbi:MAG: MFS transporter [Phycisphaerales bacterium]|nr:MFS transporter [Phycisphaerales bacterium]
MTSAPVTELRSNLHRIYCDAVAFSLMVGAGETYLPAFVLALGMGELMAGLVASIPMLAGALLQLVSPAAVRRLGSHKRWVVLCALAQAASFLPLIVAALSGRIQPFAVFAIAALYWGAGMATGPAWNTWVGTLVPVRIRAHYFARRSRAAHMAVLAGLAIGGIGLQVGASLHKPLLAFALLFLLSGTCRFLSAALLAGQSEPIPLSTNHREVPWREFLGRFRHQPDGRLLLYMLATQIAVQISGPFFTPYMLGEMKLSYGNYLLLIATSYSSRILVLPALGGLVRRVGVRRVLWLAGLGVVPLSALWVVSDSMLYLFVVQLFAGAVWAAYELATFLMLFETIREEERTSVLTTYNLAHAFATVGGASLGGFLLTHFGTGHAAYMAIFAISGSIRIFTIFLLARAARGFPVPTEPQPTTLPTRVLAVRPNLGSIERPILPALPEPAVARAGAPSAEAERASSSEPQRVEPADNQTSLDLALVAHWPNQAPAPPQPATTAPATPLPDPTVRATTADRASPPRP